MVNTNPGELSASLLRSIGNGNKLRIGAAEALGRVQKHFPGAYVPGPAGGYRSKAVQNAMADAGAGHSIAAKRRWNLDLHSVVRIARHPLGTHEDGYSADIWGFAITPATLAWMADNGWTRPFGERDAHHFHYSQKLDRHRPVASPVSGATYAVRHGDTLASIASHNHTTWQKLAKLNKIKDPDHISVGQKLRLK